MRLTSIILSLVFLSTPAFAGMNYPPLIPGQIPGTTTSDNASAGNIGEYISSNIASGSALSLVNGTSANLTSISLTPGDWDVTVQNIFSLSGATATYIECSTSTTTGTTDTTLGRLGESEISGAGISLSPTCSTTVRRFSLSATTTIFDVVTSGFTVGTVSAYGTISARRVR